MLELIKLECKKNLGWQEYYRLIFFIVWTAVGGLLLINKGVNYEGRRWFGSSLEVINLFEPMVIFTSIVQCSKLFGEEIKNLYVLPQGRNKILLIKLYMTIMYTIILYLPISLLILSKLNKYKKGEDLTIMALLIINLILAISLVVIAITLALKFKSTTLNQIASVVLAIVAYGIVSLYTIGLPLMRYVGIVIIIAVISAITYRLVVEKELVRDL